MCSHYESVKNHQILKSHFKIENIPEGGKDDIWPGYLGAFIRKPASDPVNAQAFSQNELLLGSFGLIPHWATDTKISRSTYNARSETVADKPSFRDAWRTTRHCIIPAEAIYEPDWRSGKAVPARISCVDNKPLGIAGLWSAWQSPKGEIIHSFTMLTINADAHPLMRQFHKPTDEKRMVVILHDDQHDDWLNASMSESIEFLREYPADLLLSTSNQSVLPHNRSLFDI
jgi:putative SOS response-associated peptidase YedK